MSILTNKKRASGYHPKKWKGRYSVLLLLWSAWLVSFLDRMVMNVSLPFIGEDLGLDKIEQASIISAFFIGYALFQIPGGYLSDKFGARKVMACAIVWWSVFTFFTGLIYILPLMLLVRFLFGLGEGGFPASSWKTIATYFPSQERGRATAIQSSVNTLGPAISVIVAVTIIEWLGWRAVFILLSLPGLVLGYLIYRMIHNHPAENPLIKPEELYELQEYNDNFNTPDNNANLLNNSQSLTDVLKMPLLWKLSLIWFLFDITFWGFTTWLPSYLLEARGLSLSKTGIWAAMPFLFGAVGTLIGGYLADKFVQRLKIIYGVTAILSASFLFFMFNVENLNAAIAFQCISALFMFIAFAIFWGMLMQLIPTVIMGKASSIVNFGGQVAGIVSPFIIGFLIEKSDGGYQSGFLFMVLSLIASAILTLFIQKITR